MSEPILGEIRMFGGNFAPRGWAMCNGQTLAISQNTALFSLIGTYYGGNGTTTFNLPDLRGRVAVNQGTGPGLTPYVIGEVTGTENVTLSISQMPRHNHTVGANNASVSATTPTNNYPGNPGFGNTQLYETSANSTMNPGMVQPAGSSTPFSIVQPLLCITFIIAVQGIFPSRN